MAEFKLVISDPKTGKSKQIDVKDNAAKGLIGKKIRDTFKGELIDLAGYEFEITGGSDSSGFPMRNDVMGQGRKKITDVNSIGVKNKRHRPNPKKKGMRTMKGMKLKKTVAGNTVYEKTAQINLKMTKMGRDSIFEEPKPAEEAKPEGEAPKAEAPKEEAPKVTEKKEEPKPEEPKVQDAKQPESSSPEAKSEEKKVEEKEEVVENEEETSDEGEVSEGHINPDGEDVGGAADAMSSPEEKKETPKEEKKEEAPEEEKEPAEEDDASDVDKETEDIEKEIAKDEEEVKKEDEEIEKIEKELKEADSEEDNKKEE